MWLADDLHMIGRDRPAREMFERVLDLRNDVGLLSEEWDPKAGRQLGNTPQAFSHVPLVNTARALSTTGAKVGRVSRREPHHYRHEASR
jgi:GH15 family glucan-1,4-alpha-glucosidase